MPVFHYQAYNAEGKTSKGTIEGDNARSVRKQLREQGLMPTQVEPLLANNRSRQKSVHLRRMRPLDVALFTRECAALIAGGIPIEEALQACAQQTDKQVVKDTVLAVRDKVLEGHSLGAGLQQFPQVFPEVYVATVVAGEESGHLDVAMEHLADHTERQQEIQAKIRQAMIYPAIMTSLSIAIVIFLLVMIVPSMIDVFKDNQQSLPPLTQVLLSISNFVTHYGIYVLALLFATIFAIRTSLRRPALKEKMQRLLLKLPLLSKTLKAVNTSRFCRTLSVLVAAGVPMIDGLRVARQIITLIPIKEALMEASKRVGEGSPLHLALKQTQYFTPITLHFIANGEKSGDLAHMLGRAAEQEDARISRLIDTLLTLFEPFLILFMGAIVLFIVLAILVPMFEMTQMIA